MRKFVDKLINNRILLSLKILKHIDLTIGWGLEHDVDCGFGFRILDLQGVKYGYMTIFNIGIWLFRISCCVDWY